jgi:plasmid stability protein
LRQRARTNNRSVSGEIRDIIEAALKEFPQGNTEQETNQ